MNDKEFNDFKSLLMKRIKDVDDSDLEFPKYKLNEEAMDRYNIANLTADTLFGNIKEIKIEKPKNRLSFIQTSVFCEDVFFEKVKKEELKEFIDMVDCICILPLDETTIHICYTINDIWED